MHFDRFDIAQAYYLFYVLNYEGMFSPSYQRLCILKKTYRPCNADQFLSGLTANGRAIYDRLVEWFPNADASVSLAFGRKNLGW